MRIIIAALMAAMPFAAQAADRETDLRCSVPADSAIYARQPGAIPSVSFGQVTNIRTGQPAPSLMVDGWQPASGPLGVVLSDLGREAGFAVTGAEGLGTVSWTRPKAPLSQVLDVLTAQVGASWSYSSGVVRILKTPVVSSGSASIALPENRDVTLALLDTLRGYQANDVTLSSTSIGFSGAAPVLSKIDAGLKGVSDIYAFDVTFMKGRPSTGRYPWVSIAGGSVVPDGAGGRFLLGEDATARLSTFLSANGDVQAGGMQTVAGPSGWALVVPQSQCGNGKIEAVIRPKRVGDGFALQLSGFGSAMDVPMVTLGQTLVVASHDPVGGWIDIISIRPRILSVR